MANPEHLKILLTGPARWNEWRQASPDIRPDLSGANLREADLRGAYLCRANLNEATLNVADLRDADLSEAHLGGANLPYAYLRGANLRSAYLHAANFHSAHLIEADLRGARLNTANLINSNLEKAKLTGASIWEIQTTGWKIKDIICENVYRDEDGKKLDEYEPGEFERIFSQKPQIELEYKKGISLVEIAMLPYLVEKIQNEHEGIGISIRAIENEGGKARVRITLEDKCNRSDEELKEELETIKTEFQGNQRLIANYQNELQNKRLVVGQQENHISNLESQIKELRVYRDSIEHPENQATELLTVLFLDLKGFSTKSSEEQLAAMNFTRSSAEALCSSFLGEPSLGKYSNTWGDAIVVGFKNPNQGIEFAIQLMEMLSVKKIQARIGMSFGECSLVLNLIQRKIAPEAPAMSEAARLEPLADSGEILISSMLKGQNLDERLYEFTQVEKALKKDVGDLKAGSAMTCYSVSRKT